MIIEEILIKGHFIIGHGWSKEFFEFQTQPAGCSPGRYNAGAAVTTNYKQPIYMYYFICRFTMYHEFMIVIVKSTSHLLGGQALKWYIF
jgi:hypothetical protein